MAKSKSYNIGGSKYAFDFDGDPIKLKGIQKTNNSGDFDGKNYINPNSSEFGDIAATEEALNAYNIDKHGGNKDLYEDTTPQATSSELNNFYNKKNKKSSNQQFVDGSIQGNFLPSNPPYKGVGANTAFKPYQYASEKGKAYSYPLDINTDQDHLKITKYDYVRPNINQSKPDLTTSDQTQNSAGDSVRGSDPLGSVFLPMPKVVDVNGAEWGESKLSAAGLAAVQTGNIAAQAAQIANIIPGNAEQQRKNEEARALLKEREQMAQTAAEETTQFLDKLGKSAQQLTTTGVAQLGATALGTNIDANTILARVGGVVQNPNAEMLFQGPVIRDFSFSFKMIARSEKEGEEIRKIIKFFKKGMAPKFKNIVFISAPNIFTLDYRNSFGRLDTVNKFNPGGLALTTLNVDYAPSGYWSAYRDSQPVAVKMDMTFTELRPIYERDQTNDDAYSGLDSVGY